MAYYAITYDVRTRPGHDYQPLYDQLNAWSAAHLQNSVWLVDLSGGASQVRETLNQHLHPDDTCCVIQVFENSDWATWNARQEGVDWMRTHLGR